MTNAVIDPLFRMTGMSLTAFGASVWDREPLLRRAAELPVPTFDDLFTLGDVDELLSSRGLRTPFLRMTRDGEILPTARFTRSGGAGADIADQVADDKVLAEFGAGATIVLQALHRTWSVVADFTTALVARIGHPTQVNAYVTPPQNTGFAAHYDVHDVFVLQFAGRKHWRVHEPVLTRPLRDQPSGGRLAAVSARAAEPPLLDIVLEPGDALYLPRGYVHAATSLGEVSGHLTVGVHPVTRTALVERVVAALAAEPELRRSLPLGVDLADPAALAADLEATATLIRAALDRLDPEAIAKGIGRHLSATTRPASLRPLAQLAAAASLDGERRVRLRPGGRPTLRDDARGVAIELPERTITLEGVSADTVRRALSGEAVAARDLPGTDVEVGVRLLSRLLREGILVPE